MDHNTLQQALVNSNAIQVLAAPAGKDWHMDSDYGQASIEVGGSYLTTIAIDCLLALVTAFEKLTDIAVEAVPSTPKAAGEQRRQAGLLHASMQLSCALKCWRTWP